MSEKINYIKHLHFIHTRFVEDNRLSPWHISLYYALFHCWNHFKFQTPLSINRFEMMESSKIGSANTYLKCLRELDAWGYIKYVPSKNPMKGSQVYLYKINTSTDTSTDTSSDTSADTSSDTSLVLVLRPSINNNKHNKQMKTIINTNSKELVNTQNENEENFNSKKKKNVSKKVETNTPKNLEEVETYFLEKEKPKSEAHKFFNYYEANGWLVGKNKMKNWRAAANNWISNIGKYSSQPQEEKTTYLHVNQDKDYSIPL